ncbi:MAG: methionyl aminopeptidase [Chitinivibrionales bacterium]|nr:methionyl aminopeptidase [Chitinivibrionales bacterium]
MTERNEPCWCGSGKKYKKCHWEVDSQKTTTSKQPASRNPLIKSELEIAGMIKAGAFNGELMDFIRPFIVEGISTERINTLAHEYTIDHGHIPACLGYRSFPKSVCTSINNVVCHGIPSEKEILKAGDIINVDLTTIVDGFFGDSSETFMIGAVSELARHVVTVSAQALLIGIHAVKPGQMLSAIAEAIEPFAISKNCSVVRQYTGHGIGKKFHEAFTVCHHRTADCEQIQLAAGMTFTIEPMINLGSYKVVTDPVDHWTVRTKDGSLSAQFEHTVLVTETGFQVLTLTPSQKAAQVLLALPIQE